MNRFILTGNLSNFSTWLFFFPCYNENFYLKESTVQLLFGGPKLPGSLLLCFGSLTKYNEATWTQALGYITGNLTACTGQSESSSRYSEQRASERL